MIAYLNGLLTAVEPTYALLECAGVGYRLKISLTTYERLKPLQPPAPLQLWTHYQVREDAHLLYGFTEPAEREMFERLLSVSGVGGNGALSILSSLTVEELQSAIANQDAVRLKKIKGVGEKTAGRLLLELKDKFPAGISYVPSAGASGPPGGRLRGEAVAALVSLGFPKATAEKKIDTILARTETPPTLEALIKMGLQT